MGFNRSISCAVSILKSQQSSSASRFNSINRLACSAMCGASDSPLMPCHVLSLLVGFYKGDRAPELGDVNRMARPQRTQKRCRARRDLCRR
jgi:hypothetical protein